MTAFRHLALSAALLALSGCALAPYKPAPGEPTALINVKNVPSPSICDAQGRQFSLQPGKDSLARIPADEPLMLGSVLQYQGYNVVWTCAPTVGFTPAADQTYYGVVESANQACRYEVYRTDTANRTGLGLESTVTRGTCPAK